MHRLYMMWKRIYYVKPKKHKKTKMWIGYANVRYGWVYAWTLG